MKDIINEKINKVIFLADVHFGKSSASLEWIDNTVGYFENFFFPKVRSEIMAGYNPCVIIAGDFFDDRQRLDLNVMHTAVDMMKKMSAICPVYIVIGNHDIYKTSDCDITSLSVFDRMDNVTIVHDTARLTIAEGKKIFMVSWVGDHVAETKILSDNSNDADIVVLHTEISGMKMDQVRPINDGVNVSAVTGKRIYSGHIHTRQDNKNVTYLGSPYDTTRTDTGNIKGIYSVAVENGRLVETFEENTYSPRFVKYTYDELSAAADMSSLIHNNYTDIYLKDGQLSTAQLKKFYALVEASSPKSVTYYMQPSDEVKIDTTKSATENIEVEEVANDVIRSQDELTEEDKKVLVKLNDYYNKRAIEELGQV